MVELPLHKNQEFLLDTCVLQDLSSPRIGKKVLEILGGLTVKGAKLAISQYCAFELLRGANKKNEEAGLGIINSFKNYIVSDNVFLMAARLTTLYKNEKTDSGISDGDKIIAATSIITSAPIITRDGSDFPRPFFKELKCETITYDEKKRRKKTTVMFFLEPNYEVITKKFEER
ncbi:MAG: hypothetical protein KJI71_04930 [Patescibacteria group bacterium]|nr:hypothetical protein [Patescibacteria group bacterium]